MKAIILAAGTGSRLNIQIPKALCKITADKRLLDFQIQSIAKRIDKKNIIVVVGYKKEEIINRYADLSFVHNEYYLTTNTAKSLLLGLHQVDEDVLYVAGDVFFEDKILELVLDSEISCCVVKRKNCTRDEVRYAIDKNHLLKKLGKYDIENYEGEALGIYMIKKHDLNLLKKKLECVDDNTYFHSALNNLISSRMMKLRPVYADNMYCKEIDFEKDLEILQHHVQSL